jgi:hypothetical protein
MARKLEANTWQDDPADVITLVNKTSRNYILDLPSGRVRLDAGRRMRTLKSILDVAGIRDLVNEGSLEVVFE